MNVKKLSTRLWVAALFMMSFSTALGGCQKHQYTRVKLEVTVDDNGKLYRASSVQQYSCRQSTHIMSDSANCGVKGEAVVVKIGDKGDLFVILDRSGARNSTAMVWSVLGAVSETPMTENNGTLPKFWSLRFDQMPLMVKFTDLSDPYSVEAVDPERLDVSFGNGVRLVSMEVKPTSEPVTFGSVKAELPWITQSGIFQKGSRRNRLAEDLGTTTFVIGEDQ